MLRDGEQRSPAIGVDPLATFGNSSGHCVQVGFVDPAGELNQSGARDADHRLNAEVERVFQNLALVGEFQVLEAGG